MSIYNSKPDTLRHIFMVQKYGTRIVYFLKDTLKYIQENKSDHEYTTHKNGYYNVNMLCNPSVDKEKLIIYIEKIIRVLEVQLKNHDSSKLSPEEKPLFDIHTPKLRTMKFDSPEYKQSLLDLKPALDHHYKINSHHPEHYENGMKGMNIIDICEMIADWFAAAFRQKDPEPFAMNVFNLSLRFNYDPNTAILLAQMDNIINDNTQLLTNKPFDKTIPQNILTYTLCCLASITFKYADDIVANHIVRNTITVLGD